MSCPANPPSPPGYQIWRGPVPAPLVQWAIDLRDHVNKFPYGQTWSLTFNGSSVLARKDRHSWTYRNGALVTGLCIPGITLYSPKPTAATASETNSIDSLDTPDPTVAAYTIDTGIDWKLVAISGAAGAAVVAAFFLALHHAGRANRTLRH